MRRTRTPGSLPRSRATRSLVSSQSLAPNGVKFTTLSATTFKVSPINQQDTPKDQLNLEDSPAYKETCRLAKEVIARNRFLEDLLVHTEEYRRRITQIRTFSRDILRDYSDILFLRSSKADERTKLLRSRRKSVELGVSTLDSFQKDRLADSARLEAMINRLFSLRSQQVQFTALNSEMRLQNQISQRFSISARKEALLARLADCEAQLTQVTAKIEREKEAEREAQVAWLETRKQPVSFALLIDGQADKETAFELIAKYGLTRESLKLATSLTPGLAAGALSRKLSFDFVFSSPEAFALAEGELLKILASISGKKEAVACLVASPEPELLRDFTAFLPLVLLRSLRKSGHRTAKLCAKICEKILSLDSETPGLEAQLREPLDESPLGSTHTFQYFSQSENLLDPTEDAPCMKLTLCSLCSEEPGCERSIRKFESLPPPDFALSFFIDHATIAKSEANPKVGASAMTALKILDAFNSKKISDR